MIMKSNTSEMAMRQIIHGSKLSTQSHSFPSKQIRTMQNVSTNVGKYTTLIFDSKYFRIRLSGLNSQRNFLHVYYYAKLHNGNQCPEPKIIMRSPFSFLFSIYFSATLSLSITLSPPSFALSPFLAISLVRSLYLSGPLCLWFCRQQKC